MSSATLPPTSVSPEEPKAVAKGTALEVREFLPEWRPNIDHLVFEDGQPVESPFAERQMRLWVDPLYVSWQGPPPEGKFAAMSNVGLFYEPKQTQLVPDGLLSCGVVVHANPFPREHQSYLIWEYGKPPDVVLELVSDKHGGELNYKMQRYAQMRITYYVVFDPKHCLGDQDLYVFKFEGLEYAPMTEAWFPALGLGLKLWHGAYQGVTATWLRWHTADGQWVKTGEEQKERADQAAQRADAAQKQAEAERLAKEKLLAQLQALGVRPEL